MKAEEYLNERVIRQFEWNNKKAIAFKRRYLIFRFATLLMSAGIPFLTLFVESDTRNIVRYAIAGLGSMIVVCEGLLALYKFHENWLQYRGIAEALKREQFLYETHQGEYKKEETRYELLVQRVENVLASGNESYLERMKQDAKKNS